MRRRSDQKDDALARARVLDLKVEIANFAREISTSIQQYQIVELGSPQSSRYLEAIGRINANAVTPEDISAHHEHPAISNRRAWFATELAPPGGYRSHQRQCRDSGRHSRARCGEAGGDRWGEGSCHR